MIKYFVFSFLIFFCSSCDWGTHVINKISGHEECGQNDSKVAYHEEGLNHG